MRPASHPRALVGALLALALTAAGCAAEPDTTYGRSGDDVADTDTLPPHARAVPPGGAYAEPITVALLLSEPGRIHYTTDGSEPTSASATFSDPIPLTSDTVVRFFGVDDAGNGGDLEQATYTISDGPEPPPPPPPPLEVTVLSGPTPSELPPGAQAELTFTASDAGAWRLLVAGAAAPPLALGTFGAADEVASATVARSELDGRTGDIGLIIDVTAADGRRGFATASVRVPPPEPDDPDPVPPEAPFVVEPSPLDLGAATPGAPAGPGVLTVRSAWPLPLAGLSLALDGPAAFGLTAPLGELSVCDAAVPLAPGGSCAVGVIFTAERDGPAAAVLTVGFDGVAPASVVVRGVGAGFASAEIGTDADEGGLDFGAVAAPATRRVTVLNVGRSPSAGLLVRVEGAGFSLAADGCSLARLDPGASCPVDVGFVPPGPGDHSGHLRIWGENPVDVRLSGRGEGLGAAALEVDPPAEVLDLGEAHDPTTRRVVIRNAGLSISGSLRVSVDGEAFSVTPPAPDQAPPPCAGLALPPAADCTADVRFTPARNGAHVGALLITDGDAAARLTLTGAGLGFDPAALTAAPDRRDLGPVRRGEVSAPATVTVRNEGDLAATELSWRFEGDADDFEASPAQDGGCAPGGLLPGDATCALHVRFAPRRSGERRAVLLVEGTGVEGAAAVEVVGLGEGFTPASLVVRPEAMDFGEVARLEAGDPRIAFVDNAGDFAAQALAVRVQGAHAGDFPIDPAARDDACEDGGVLAARATCTVTLAFTPRGEGGRQATLDVSAEGAAAAPVPLTGLGVGFGPPVLDVAALPAGDFGTAHDPATRRFTFLNRGQVATGSLSVRLTGDAPFAIAPGDDGCGGRTLPGDGECDVSVTFAPRANGSFEALLAVEDADQRAEVALLGIGEGWIPPDLSADPDAVDFGDVGDEPESEQVSLSFTNAGEAPLTGVAWSLDGGDVAAFRVVAGNGDAPLPCEDGGELAGGASCSLVAQMIPGDLDGELATTLSFGGAEDSVEVTLAGRTTPPEGSQIFEASGTFVVPAGVSTVRVVVVGGGAGGGGGHNGGGGSGWVTVAEVDAEGEIAVTVGQGGAGAPTRDDNSQPSGTNGGQSSFGGLVTANGGETTPGINTRGGHGGCGGGGACNSGNPGGNGGTSGAGGTGCTYPGGNGQGNYAGALAQLVVRTVTAGGGGNGGTSSHSGGGGGGGVLIDGAGPSAANGIFGQSGKGGTGYGAGGGAGGCCYGSPSSRAGGGRGADGVVYVEWN